MSVIRPVISLVISPVIKSSISGGTTPTPPDPTPTYAVVSDEVLVVSDGVQVVSTPGS